MVLSKYSLCSWYLFLSPSDLWLWNCSSVKRMIFFSSCLSICPWDLREKSHLCHSRCRADVLMRGAIRGLQSDSNVWIIFKLNDNEGFSPQYSEFTFSCFQTRRAGVLPSELNRKLGVFSRSSLAQRKPGGAAVRNNSAPLTQDPLVREKVFLCDIYAHCSAAPRASFLPI